MIDNDIVTELRSQLRAAQVPYDEARANEMIDAAVHANGALDLAERQGPIVAIGADPGGVRHHRLTRYLVPLAAAATVVAVASVSLALTSGHGATKRAAAPGSSPPPTPATVPAPSQPEFGLAWHFTVNPVPGYDIKRIEITNTSQAADVTAHGQPKSSGDITVYEKGVLNSAQQPNSTAVTVHGRGGFFGMVSGKPTLGWQYADGAWAVVSGDWGFQPDTTTYDMAAARAAEQLIADAVDTSASEPFLIDFTAGWLPPGLVYEQGVDVFGPNNTPMVMLGFGDRNSSADLPKSKVTYGGSALTITRQVGLHGNPPNLTVGGRPAFYDDLGLTVDLADGSQLYVGIAADHRGTFSKADLIKIATNVSVTPDPADRATWVPASASMPR